MSTETLFPPIQPFHSGFLSVSEKHTLYYEEVGNPKGKPVIFLHGGPGGSIRPKSRTYFDPAFYHIILFDQRGTGKSTPKLELHENTTMHLVDDIEKLRKFLGIENWLVFGGSWGSTLALMYAIHYPQLVNGLILRGIFLGRQKELRWLYQDGACRLRPQQWQDFIAPIPIEEQDNLLQAYYRRLVSGTEEDKIRYAKKWNAWEDANAFHLPQPEVDQKDLLSDEARYEADRSELALALIETHYFMNHCFFDDENYIMKQLEKIYAIPCQIVQGQYDTVCPPQTAWELKQNYPQAKLTLVPDGGHAGSIGNMAVELVRATEEFKQYCR